MQRYDMTALGGEPAEMLWRGHRVAFTRHGQGSAVLLVHGLYPGASSFEWRHTIPSLAERHTVFALDLLGFGRSDRPAARYSPGLYQALLADTVSGVVGESCAVVASGLSAAQLIALAVRDPRHIASIALVAPTGVAHRRERSAPRRSNAARFLGAPLLGNTIYNRLTSPVNLRRHLEAVYVNDRLVTPELVQEYVHSARLPGGKHAIAALLAGSAINQSHEHCGRVQDAYSLRCAAQTHGAARDALTFARATVTTEMNAATDNPMVFAGDDEILSGGNFHGAPVAIAADLAVIALAQFANISERRSDRLVDPSLSDLPAFLTAESGLHSGYMLAQVTAAALASEIKTLAHPASVDTIPTSANREDHVSMSMGAALKAERALQLATRVIAVEILCACQAIDLLAPLKTSAPLDRVHARVRSIVPRLVGDRPPAPDIEAIAQMIADGSLEAACEMEVK